MIPYFQFDQIIFGPITLQVWGLLVSLGIVFALTVAYKLTQKYFFSEQVILDLAVWGIVGGIIGARAFHIIFYYPEYYILHPSEIFFIWQGGMSSMGGLLGAAVAVYILAKIKKFTWKELLPYLDIISVSFWLGWAIGRIGCFLIHDHLGRLSSFFLAVRFPAEARFDLGLWESLLALALFIVFISLFKKFAKFGWGYVSALSFAIYALVRFFLDFLRATDIPQADPRYFYLTPAQWGMGALFFTLTFVVIFAIVKRQKIGEVA